MAFRTRAGATAGTLGSSEVVESEASVESKKLSAHTKVKIS